MPTRNLINAIIAAAIAAVVAFSVVPSVNAEKISVPAGCWISYEMDDNQVVEIYLVCPADDGGEDWTPVLNPGEPIHVAPAKEEEPKAAITEVPGPWSVCIPCVLDNLDNSY